MTMAVEVELGVRGLSPNRCGCSRLVWGDANSVCCHRYSSRGSRQHSSHQFISLSGTDLRPHSLAWQRHGRQLPRSRALRHPETREIKSMHRIGACSIDERSDSQLLVVVTLLVAPIGKTPEFVASWRHPHAAATTACAPLRKSFRRLICPILKSPSRIFQYTNFSLADNHRPVPATTRPDREW